MNPLLLYISDFMACIFVAITFLVLIEFKYSQKVTVIYMVIFIVAASLVYLKLIFIGTNEGVASAITFTIPSLIFCFFLSKNKDSRFIFTFCSVDTIGLIIISISRIIAILFHIQSVIIFLLTNIGLLLMLIIAWKFRKIYIQIQKTLQSGWRNFAVVSALNYVMIYLIFCYPVPIKERKEYLPVGIFYSITIIFVYIVIYQTVMKSVKIHDEQKDRELLETKIALQNSQLELKEMYYKMAYTDALTGLRNRADFEEKKKSLFDNINNEDMLACLSMDLNNLKETNDIHGHNAGDELIKVFSNMLKESFDDLQNIYRVGGDEFIVMLSGMSSKYIGQKIAKLKQKIIHNNKQNKIKISFAMGIASINEEHIKGIDSLIVCADKRMYENKKNMKS